MVFESKKMDLVSTTLDKYLKHRFNGSGLERTSGDRAVQQTASDEISKLVPTQTNNNDNSFEPPSPQATKIEPSQAINETDNSTTNLTTTNSSGNPVASELASSELQQPQQRIVTTNHIVSNGNTDNDCKLPTIHNISISNTQPCCVALREDLQYLAAGFENSHIYLWKLKHDDGSPKIDSDTMFTLLAHSGPVYSIEFVKNSDLMLSCSEDTTIRLWCLNTKCNVIVYRGHNYPIWSIDIGSQGKFFASASMDGTARLWRLDRITPLRIFCGHHDDVECVKFHPNEKYVASGSSDTTVRLWSVSDGKMVRLMVGHKDPIISLSFLPDGKFLASASRDGVIKVWNLAANSVTSELSVPASYSISFSPEQKFVSSCGADNVLRLWQVDKSDFVKKKEIDFEALVSSTLIQSQFHRDNKLFVISYLTEEKNAVK